MIEKICPCLAFLYKKQTPTSKTHHDYEEQQFMEHLQTQSKPSNLYSYESTGEHISVEEQLERELSPQPPQHSLPEEHIEIVPKQEEPEQKKIDESDDLLQIQKVPIFRNNIDKSSQYYHIIEQSTGNIERLLNSKIDSKQLKISTGKLSINKIEFKIWEKRAEKGRRAYLINYKLPCSYSFYNDIMNRTYHSQENDKFITQNKLIESIYPNLSKKFICLNKISLAGKMMFSYLKYTNGNQRYHWEICISQDEPDYDATDTRFKKVNIKSFSLLTEQSVQGQAFLDIKTYVDIQDIVKVEKVWEKVYQHYRSYLDFIWEQANKSYQQEIC